MSNSKRVYVASPIRRGDLAANVNGATVASLHLAACGFAPFTPQWSVYSASPALNRSDGRVDCIGDSEGMLAHEDWMGVDLAWVEVADLLLRLPGASEGADREVAAAESKGIPVYYDVKSICGEPRFVATLLLTRLPRYSWNREESQRRFYAYRREDAEFLARFYEAHFRGDGWLVESEWIEELSSSSPSIPSPTTKTETEESQ